MTITLIRKDLSLDEQRPASKFTPEQMAAILARSQQMVNQCEDTIVKSEEASVELSANCDAFNATVNELEECKK